MRLPVSVGALALGLVTMISTAHANVTMVLRQDVAEYSIWRKMYDGMQGMQGPMDVAKSSVYQAVDNPNDVTLVRDFATEDAAKSFFASYTVRNAIRGGGSKAAPNIWITAQAPGATGHEGKVRLFVHHAVAEYSTWRKAYDSFVPAMHKLGVVAQGILQLEGSPNEVIVYHDFSSDGKAKAFAVSPELKSAMQRAGVKGEPQIWITSLAAK